MGGLSIRKNMTMYHQKKKTFFFPVMYIHNITLVVIVLKDFSSLYVIFQSARGHAP